jgi:hypothetical protein
MHGTGSDDSYRTSIEVPGGHDHFELLKATWVPGQPLRCRHFLGSHELTDALFTGFASLLLISQSLQDAMATAGLTGWRTFPVDLYDGETHIEGKYAGLSFVGRCGPILPPTGPALTDFPQLPSFPRYRGLYFEESSWDGSDFWCSTDDTAYRFVTNRARSLFEEVCPGCLRFTPLAEVERFA